MKQKIRTSLIGTILALCVGLSSLACFVTGFEMSVSLWTVAFWCFVGGTLCAVCCNTKFGIVPFGILVLVLGYLWQGGLLEECFAMDCSTPGLPVHHQLPEFTQTHVHQVGDAVQPSYPLSAPSPPTFNLS